jgi:molecular chaperone DnaK (HSP70)
MNVGIDLGTTNSALAYVDPREAGVRPGHSDDRPGHSDDRAFPPIRVLPIPQSVTADRVEPVRVLPSFLYLGDREYVGVHAREQGAVVPTRLVHSAKSWLANSEVDRTAKILPWDSEEIGRVLSPVEVSAKFLRHLREAWDRERGTPLADEDVVLAVPASFDEEARELTVQAANDAGLRKLTLLEEPAAAFYSWIANHLQESRGNLVDGQTVLVVDVGGGTSDFTLVRVARDGDRIDFTRTAVGKHLLLGGDNLDLALARLVEGKLGASLSLRQRNAVRRQCSAAKERLLSDPDVDSVEVTVVGAGTALVGGVRKAELYGKEVLDLALDGFLPPCALNERPREDKRVLFRELGLPYVSDPAITRHLAEFLGGAADHARHGIDAILFNGGFFVPDVLRDRVTDIVESWYGRRPAMLENRDPDLAVAVGAAYYSFVRSGGQGVIVRGGLPRAYYVGIASPDPERTRAVCLVPRGTEDGTTLELGRDDLRLRANRPVSFRLYSSLVRTDDPLGAVIEVAREEAASELHVHAPLNAVMRFGKQKDERLIPVKLGARLTEIGTLELWCASTITEHRWRLQFELRKVMTQAGGLPSPAATIVGGDALENAKALIRNVFGRERTIAPAELPGKLEQTLGLGKASWPLGAIRDLADVLLEVADGRRVAPEYEVRWLNVAGFCLRPGFGAPGDDFRIEQARRVYGLGLAYPDEFENELQWWILWGRVAGGLNANQQAEIFQRLLPSLMPAGGKRTRVHPTVRREMWRAAASFELLPLRTKIELGEAVASTVRSGRFSESELWCLMRLGARRLFYGPANQVVPPASAGSWVEALLPVDRAADAVATIARRTGDPVRDLPEAVIDEVRRALATRPDAARRLAMLDGEEELDRGGLDRMFGEHLPSGLVTG